MAITHSKSWHEVALDAGRSFFHHKQEQAREVLANRRVYRETYRELSMLADRDLADLGIPRCSIRRLAKEAAYGQ